MLFSWIKKIDIIVPILIFTIGIGVVVITMRSKTYSIGYEIASLKAKEKNLREKQIDLQIQLSSLKHSFRTKWINSKDVTSGQRYIFPDQLHVIDLSNEKEKEKGKHL